MSNNNATLELSKRELQVLEMVATGASNQQIARQLVISVNTVKVHLRNIFEKLDVQSRTEATLRAIQEGLITVDENPTPVEENSAPPKTYLLATSTQPVLAQWQQFYLVVAVLLALGVTILPLLPQRLPKTDPNLPVIFAQPPTPIPVTSNANPWVSQSAMPTKRAGLSLVAFDRQLFAMGGVRSNNKATRSVEIYDTNTDSWAEGQAKPTATANITGVVLDDKIYVPGGCTNQGEAITALEIYDPLTDNWEQGEPLPAARCGYGLVAFQDKLFLFGGWNGQEFADTIFVYTLENNTWQTLATHLPQTMGYMGAAVLDEQIYVVGGYDGQAEFDHTYTFAPETEEWTEKSPLNEKRGGLNLIGTSNNLFAIGGGWEQAVTTSEKYDPTTDTWTTFDTPFNHQWRNMGATAIDTRIYAAGGWDGSDEQYMDSLVSYQFVFQLFLPISTGN